MKEYYLTKIQHSPTTLCLTKEKILSLSCEKDTDNNWVLHEAGVFFTKTPLVYGTIKDIQEFIIKEKRK